MNYIVTYFPGFGRNAIGELLALDGHLSERHMSPSISLVETAYDPDVFIRRLVESSPIFVRHIMPVLHTGPVANDKETDCSRILATAVEICRLQAGQLFSVQCRIVDSHMAYTSKDIEVFVGSHFEAGGAVPEFSDREILNLDIDIISILICGGSYYLGYSKASDNLNSHCDEYRVLSRTGVEICRAENKLKEAICKFNLSFARGGCALDIGAAPGGWTKVLADYGLHVTAVDPGDLHEALKDNRDIAHHKERIENVSLSSKFDIIVNDMNVDPQITSAIMCDVRTHLADDGVAIVTLKLPFGDVSRSIRESVDILSAKYEVVSIRNLSHNRREVTALLRPKGARRTGVDG